MITATLAAIAIVTADQAPLRAAPKESATQQAVLWQGDSLEIRGQRLDYLQVYDHRRERAGFIHTSQVRTSSLKPAEAPELLSVLRFVRDTPGAEALGIAYAAAYLKAAPAQQIDVEAFDALGGMAERLARRASMRQARAETVAAHLEVAAFYGVKIIGYEFDGVMRLCYDGEAFRRVLALSADAVQRARAALALTRHDCVAPDLGPHARLQTDLWRAGVLDRVDATQFAQLPEQMKNRLRLRRAGVWAGLAFQQTRKGESGAPAAARAIDEIAGVNKAELSDDDALDYAEAAVRVNASRWAAVSPGEAAARLAVVIQAGQPGETCVSLVDAKRDVARPLARRCTFGIVWAASTSASPAGNALALAVQPLDAWRELWLFRKVAGEWNIDVLPPSATGPNIGAIEFAGWVPGGEQMLIAREARENGRFLRSFEVVRLATLGTEKRAGDPALLVAFGRWQDLAWKARSLTMR